MNAKEARLTSAASAIRKFAKDALKECVDSRDKLNLKTILANAEQICNRTPITK